MKKNIFLVQASCLYGNTYYLPYAAGMLAAFAFNNSIVSENYNFGRFVYSLEDIDSAIDSFDNPFLVGFSNSLWNYDYNHTFAQKLKKRYPECLIVFGGHHVPPDTSLLEKCDYIDFLIHDKGEEAFRDLLLYACGEIDCRSNIPNISYREPDGTPIKTAKKHITIFEYPSPYLSGFFDELLENNEYPFSCILETNRGCPYDCSYCDWGELNSPVRMMPFERVQKELEWMSERKMEFCYCVDANFGMFERDEKIAELLVDLKRTTGYPQRLQVSYAKNQPKRVFRINSMLSKEGLSKGATLSFQSLNPDVLHNINRENMSMKEFKNHLSLYHEAGIPTYTELILGLPGETYDSFCSGLCELLEMGQHKSVSVYYCELLPNSQMSTKEYIEEHGIGTISTFLNQYHCEKMDDKLSGFSHIVVETNSMSREEWIEANMFSVCVQSFHHFGLLQCFAIYLHNEKGISYFDFYSSLLRWVREKSVFCKSIFNSVSEELKRFVNGNGGLTYQNDVFGIITWPFEEAVFLDLAYELDKFYNEVEGFLKSFDIDNSIYNELLRYQKSVIVLPGRNYLSVNLNYDFYDYFENTLSNHPIPLEKKQNTVIFENSDIADNWPEYAQFTIWYGRRNGRMIFTNNSSNVTVEK